jgi:hypothetical protein
MTQEFFGHNPLKWIRHPPYYPDISPPDFYPFRKGDGALIGSEIPDKIDLFEPVTEIVNNISDPELQHIFRSWIDCVERVIDAGGGHLTE